MSETPEEIPEAPERAADHLKARRDKLDSLVAVLETLGLELKLTARNSQAARAAGPPAENSPEQ